MRIRMGGKQFRTKVKVKIRTKGLYHKTKRLFGSLRKKTTGKDPIRSTLDPNATVTGSMVGQAPVSAMRAEKKVSRVQRENQYKDTTPAMRLGGLMGGLGVKTAPAPAQPRRAVAKSYSAPPPPERKVAQAAPATARRKNKKISRKV